MVPTLDHFTTIDWTLISRTYGNCHSTLIGAMVLWWLKHFPDTSVMESGPTHAYHKKGVGSTHCDALLLHKEKAIGVLEVEGTRYPETFKKMCEFLTSSESHWKHLEFGVLVGYAYGPEGSGRDRAIPKVELSHFYEHDLPAISKPVFVLLMQKDFPSKEDRSPEYDRYRASEYYFGAFSSVYILKVLNGRGCKPEQLWSRSTG